MSVNVGSSVWVRFLSLFSSGPPGRSRCFCWDLPSFETPFHPLAPALREGGTGQIGRPSQELRVRAGRREAVDFAECFGFWVFFLFCFLFLFLFLNRAILCSVQAVKKNIYQCFPIKYSDYLSGLFHLPSFFLYGQVTEDRYYPGPAVWVCLCEDFRDRPTIRRTLRGT